MEIHPLRSETDFVFVRSCRHVAGDRVDQTAVSTGVENPLFLCHVLCCKLLVYQAGSLVV